MKVQLLYAITNGYFIATSFALTPKLLLMLPQEVATRATTTRATVGNPIKTVYGRGYVLFLAIPTDEAKGVCGSEVASHQVASRKSSSRNLTKQHQQTTIESNRKIEVCRCR